MSISLGLRRLLSVCIAIIVGVLSWSSAAIAAETSENAEPIPVAPLTELDATDIPSEKVDQFVSAYLEVATLIDERSEDLQRAETEAESRRLQRAIEADAFQRIQDAGLTRQDYLQLLGLANTDPEFRERVLAQLEEQNS